MAVHTKEVSVISLGAISERVRKNDPTLKTDILLEHSQKLPNGDIIVYQLFGTDILSELTDFEDTVKTLTSYSIHITKFAKDEYDQLYIAEASSSDDFTRTSQRAFDFYTAAVRNTVTPMTLEYITDDWLGVWEF